MSTSVEHPEVFATEAILTQLANLGPPSEIRSQAPAIAARSLNFDRVLLTGIMSGMLEAQALYVASDSQAEVMLSRLRETPVALEYPLIEGEIMRRRRAQLIVGAGAGTDARAFGRLLAWGDYVTAPIVLDGRVLGFFHADRQVSGPSLGTHDVATLSSFALCFGLVFERAVLRHRLRVQLEEMERFSRWASVRTSELGDRTVTLTETSGDRGRGTVGASGVGESAFRDLLTQRELDVLRLMVRGATNPGIATELVISPGTVKYHVKNILRKLHASNRAEATSRYLRLTLKG
jgi:DNA-binding CsgD family transcriptional regulator